MDGPQELNQENPLVVRKNHAAGIFISGRTKVSIKSDLLKKIQKYMQNIKC